MFSISDRYLVTTTCRCNYINKSSRSNILSMLLFLRTNGISRSIQDTCQCYSYKYKTRRRKKKMTKTKTLNATNPCRRWASHILRSPLYITWHYKCCAGKPYYREKTCRFFNLNIKLDSQRVLIFSTGLLWTTSNINK